MKLNLIRAISRWSETQPDAVAVRSESGVLTYAELEQRANHLASRLQATSNWTAGAMVGIHAERSLELVIMLLGTLKAGAAYVPLDPAYPVERLCWIAGDAGCAVVLTHAAVAESIRIEGVDCLLVDSSDKGGDCVASERAIADRAPGHLAYAIYTSGSTGRPKGVMIGHGALVNHMTWMNERFPLGTDDRVLQKTSIGFDAAVWEFWAPLMQGAQLVMARAGAEGDSAYLANVLQRERITVLQLVPSMLEALLDEEAFCNNRVLKRVYCGGEALHTGVVRRFMDRLPAELVNLYGPTETTIDATFWVCRADDTGFTAPIGHAIANTRLFVLDEHGQSVPDGEIGELCIAGSCVGDGYINLPEQTAERFVAAPDGSGRMYRTGDNVRRFTNGALEFIGRSDHQVKLRGHRIELSEIEAVLKTHAMVCQAVVLVHERRLIGLVVAKQTDLALDQSIREHASQLLPRYMVPDAIVSVEVMPLLPNGKIDRTALADRVAVHSLMTRAVTQPRTETETTLAAIWRELLGSDAVGIDENLFDIGGNSLIATRLAARIRKTFAIELPLKVIFEHPLIESLATQIDAGAFAQVASGLPHFTRSGAAPLSFAQERVWIIQQMAPDNLAYAFRTVTRLSGPLDDAVLRATLTEIIRRHEIFRTTFPLVDGQPAQVVHEPWAPQLDVIEVSGDDAQAQVDGIVAREFRRGFDLTELPLIRWKLIRLGAEEHLLAQMEHHLVHDGWSFNIYLREFKELYEAFAAGRPSDLPPLKYQFSDYAAWEREWFRTSAQCAVQTTYWRDALDGAPPLLELDVARTRPELPTYRGGLHRVLVPDAIARGLRVLCKEEGVTLFMAMLAVFKLLLHKHSGEADILVGSGVANRRWLESESMMGMMLNTVAFRTRLHGDPSFKELLGRVRKSTIDAYANQDLPFQHVVKAARVPRDVRCNPIVQMMFNFHDAPLPLLDMSGIRVEVNDLMENGSAKFDLSLIAIPRLERGVGLNAQQIDESILVIWEFSTDLFARETIEELARTYVSWLGRLALSPLTRPSDLFAADDSAASGARFDHVPPLKQAREEFRL